MLTKLTALLALSMTLGAGQGAATLRIHVALTDAAGIATPIPRLVLLVSDNPPTAEPRRVRTTTDGTIELKLTPGSYLVELDEPVAFRGKAYTWTQIVEVAVGRETVLHLSTTNAEAAAAARINADSATLLASWRDSIVEIWTPTTHAAGFVIDAANGLIATSHHALANATTVEVQFTSGKERFKVGGQVIVSERDPGAAVVRVDPDAVSSARAIDLGCTAASWQTVKYKDVVNTITASMLADKEISDGLVTRTTSQAVFTDMRVGSDSEGGPVFAESGVVLGIGAIDDDKEERGRWNDVWVVPAGRACGVVAAAVKKIAGVAPPIGTRLPLEPPTRAVQLAKPAAPATQPPTLAASNFDITLLTPAQVTDETKGQSGLRGDVGNWSQYVRDAGPVLLVRVSPRFEESVLKMLARGAAATQGMSIPPLRSFTANFVRLRAYCGDAEVTPIHPFVIEHEVSGRSPIREGLYVFDRGAFGPHCPEVRFSMFSEKDPQRADVKAIDPKLFDQLPRP